MVERKRDLLWEELVAVCGASPGEMTKSERGRYNHALAELREAGATPEQVRQRAGEYRSRYSGAPLTPTALAAHWSALRPQARVPRPLIKQPPEEALEAAIAQAEVSRCSKHARLGCRECSEAAKNQFFESLKALKTDVPNE